MSIERTRLSSEESRSSAIAAARALLIEAGPQAVTLKAVAQRIGKTHANLLHHFGSAAGLQEALAEHMAVTITRAIADAAVAAQRGQAAPRTVVDMTFDAFDREGGGALASWMMLSGNENALDPIIGAIRGVVEEISAADPGRPQVAEQTLMLVLSALGDSLMGEPMAKALGLPRTAAREQATLNLLASAAMAQSPHVADAVAGWAAEQMRWNDTAPSASP